MPGFWRGEGAAKEFWCGLVPTGFTNLDDIPGLLYPLHAKNTKSLQNIFAGFVFVMVGDDRLELPTPCL